MRRKKPAFHLATVFFSAVFLLFPAASEAVVVRDAAHLAAAVHQANAGGDRTIVLEDGIYTLDEMLWIDAEGVVSNDPWIWHREHGWLYPSGTATSSIWFWDVAMNAYWWTSNTTYPHLFRYSPATWLFYHSGATPNRLFYNYSSSSWEQW